MSELIKIRVKSSNGNSVLELPISSTTTNLRESINSTLKITYDFDILVGFPPKVLEHHDNTEITSYLKNNDTIVVQSKSLSGEQAHSPNARTNPTVISTTTSKTSKPKAWGANIVSLNSKPSRKTNKSESSRSSKKTKLIGDGATLDISERLVTSVSGGKSSIDKELRDDFRKAMDLRAEDSLAMARVSSVYAETYVLSVDMESSRTLNSGESNRSLTVTFPKGHGHRSDIVEQHEIVPKELLKAVLIAALTDPAGQGREILKPYNLARLSPRTFWSLIMHYGHDIHAALAELFPSITDWSWIDDRKRELSAKALENKRQKEEADARKAIVNQSST